MGLNAKGGIKGIMSMDEHEAFEGSNEGGEVAERDVPRGRDAEYEAVELSKPKEEQQEDTLTRKRRALPAERPLPRAQRVKRRPRKKVRQAVPISEEPIEERLRTYELLYVVDAALDREEIDKISAAIVQRIEQNGGYAENVRFSEVRRLEYPIKKRQHGIYVLINFKAPPTAIEELERLLRFNENVLRHLIVLTKHKTELE